MPKLRYSESKLDAACGRLFVLLAALTLPALWVLPALAAPAKAGRTDAALAALAEGRTADGLRALRVAAEADANVRCLLGLALHRHGEHPDALETLVAVPLAAQCGRQSAFTRADALLALHKADAAAALYDEVGAPAMGPDRDAAMAAVFVSLADRVLADPDADPSGTQAIGLLNLAMGLRIEPARQVDLARRLVPLLTQPREADEPARALSSVTQWETPPKDEGVAQAVAAVLGRTLSLPGGDKLADRLLYARVADPQLGLLALAGASDREPEVLRVRAVLADRMGAAEAGLLWRERLLQAQPEPGVPDLAAPGAPASRDLLRFQTAALLNGRRVAAARPLVARLAAQNDALGIDADWRLVAVVAEAGRAAETVAAIEAHRERFPSSPHGWQAALDQARLRLAREAVTARDLRGALARYDAIISRDERGQLAPLAAFEAGLAARSLGDPEEAKRRWKAVTTHWPEMDAAAQAWISLARGLAFDDKRPDEGIALLRENERRQALSSALTAERERLGEADVQIQSPGRQGAPKAARVRVVARNLAEVEMRMHRVEPEAYLRAGGTPEQLLALDVAVIAPDARWKATVPGYTAKRDIDFEVPVPVRGPGIYVVTAAAADREASTVLLVSDLDLVARAVGPDLAVAVFRGGRPVAGVKLLLRAGDTVREEKTGRDGLYVGQIPAGPLGILALDDDAPALLALERDTAEAPTPSLTVSADLDRPIYRPGDRVGFRVAVRRGGAAVPGPWKLWLTGPGLDSRPLRLTPGRWGTVSGELGLPPVPIGPTPRAFSLMVQVPGEDEGVAVARFSVADERPAARELRVRIEAAPANGAVLSLTEPDGRPAAGVALAWSSGGDVPDGKGHTDGAGRIHVVGPAAGLPWTLQAKVAGAALSATGLRSDASNGADAPEFRGADPTLRADLEEDRLRPGEQPVLLLRGGAGPVRLVLARVGVRTDAPEAPKDPWVPAVDTEFHGPIVWAGAGPEGPTTTTEDEVWRQDVRLTGGREPLSVKLPAATEGHYRLRAVAADVRLESVVVDFHADPKAVRLLGVRDAAVGQTLSLQADGAMALVTAESDRLLGAALGRPGEPVHFEVKTPWGAEATLAATTADGQVHARAVRIDPELRVVLTLSNAAGVLSAQARVTDGAGRPVLAQVALRALDVTLETSAGAPERLTSAFLATEVLGVSAVGGVAHAFGHGGLAVEVAAALRDERTRLAESARAQAAAQGLLQENAVEGRMSGDYLLAPSVGGLGVMGSGKGGGGSGYGAGRANAIRVQSQSVAPPQVRGERGRVLWFVGETDREGRLAVTVPLPARRTTWHLTADVLSDGAFGHAETRVEPGSAPFLRISEPGSGAPDDRARLLATVVNPGDRPFEGRVQAGAEKRPVAVPPGEARTLDFGEHPPGTGLEVSLFEGERRADTHRFSFAVGDGRMEPAGPVLVVAAGPGGGPPLGWLALQMGRAPGLDALRAARAGRAALAALNGASPAERAALTEQVLQMAGALQSLEADTLPSATEHLRFATEGRALLENVQGDLEALGEIVTGLLPSAESPAERAGALLALSLAGLEIDEGALETLLQDAAELPDTAAAQLAQLLASRHREPEAAVWVRGNGPEAVLAARRLGDTRRELAAGPPPDLLAADRPAWIAARALSRPADKGAPRTGRAPVRIAGRVVGELDLAAGGVLRFIANADPARDVVVEGAPGALAWRVNPAPQAPVDAAALRAHRLPRGVSGEPVSAEAGTDGVPVTSGAFCGSVNAPCRLLVGDALSLPADVDAPEVPLPGGLAPALHASGAVQLRAVAPGRFMLHGLRIASEAGVWRPAAALSVTIDEPQAPPTPLVPSAALALATEAGAGGEDPSLLLADAATWPTPLRAVAARLLFDEALRIGALPAALIGRFERMRELQPSARLELDQIMRIARAYRTVGRPERAVAVWRAGLGAAFLAEAGGARGLESVGGLLASVRAMRDLTGRYPALPVVAEALFHLPERLGSLAEETLPAEVVHAGITATDLRLMAAAWDREFLALNPESPRAAEAGFHLVEGLFRLRAFESAADWAALLADRHADAPVLDGLLYIEGLSRAEIDEEKRALSLFDRLAVAEFPQEGGARGPAASRDDARYAAARLLEARGDLKAARTAYAAIEGRAEAAEALHALTDVRLGVDPIVRQHLGEAPRLRLDVANVDEVHLRVYKLDLRTIFLRDSGLGGVLDIRVSGVSPTWAGARKVGAGPFPRKVEVELPLRGAGAYLVQLGGGGQSAVSLVLRSDLEIAVTDGDQRRVQLRWHDGRPGKGIELRAIGDGALAERADLRGVAQVPSGAPTLAFEGEHFAYASGEAAAPEEPQQQRQYKTPASPAPKLDMMKNIDERMKQQRSRNQEMYEQQIDASPDESVEVNGL